jgi:Ni/Co efflux regulator RcnB
MRKFLAFVLLAGAAAPALAAGAPGDHQGRHRESGTQSKSEDSSDRSSSRQHSDRGNRGGNDGGSSGDHPQQKSQPVIHVERSGAGNDYQAPVTQVESTKSGGNGNAGERRHFNGITSRISSGDETPAIQPTPRDTIRPSGPKIVEPTETTTGTLREQKRSVPGVFRNRVPIVSNTPHEGTQPPLRTEARRTAKINWSTHHWRNDKRYDWKDHRRRHRSLFHLSFYYDPFGWNYRPYQIGWRLWPSYYSSRYWLNDPWQYRLPYAPPGYRWIRYYDDAILVDTWSGQVVDVIYNFFW